MLTKIVALCLLPIALIAGEPRVEIFREVVTNSISPEMWWNSHNFIVLTNIGVTVSNVTANEWSFYEKEMLQKEIFDLRSKISDLTYPKVNVQVKWLWSNTVYMVFEKNQPPVMWTNSVCFSRQKTVTSVEQDISTNVTVEYTVVLP